MGFECNVEAWHPLEEEAALLAVALAANDNKWGGKLDHVEIVGQLIWVPDLTMFGFQGLPAAGLSVDRGMQSHADRSAR